MMHPSEALEGIPALDYDRWREALHQDWGWHSPLGVKSNEFAGKVRSRSACGLVAMDLTSNARRVERTHQDVRLDAMDHYYAAFRVAGASTMIQNDQGVKIGVGDFALVDAARPVTFVSEVKGQWFCLQLPRRPMVAHLGFEPRYGGQLNRQAGRLLYQLVLDAAHDEVSTSIEADTYAAGRL